MWIWLILLAVTVGIAYLAMRPADCVIKCRRGRVAVKGKITRPQRLAIEEYLTRHFADAARLRIDVHFPKQGQRPRIQIRGDVAEGDRQMIRNFLLSEF